MSIFISPQKVKIGKFQPYSACDWLINFTINNQMVNALDEGHSIFQSREKWQKALLIR